MQDKYSIDLRSYSLSRFKENIRTRDLIPSRISLKDNLDQCFSAIEKCKISNLQELTDALKTTDKIEIFSKKSGLDKKYLTLLKREASSYLSRPSKLDSFSALPQDTALSFKKLGISNTRQLLQLVQTEKGNKALASELKISEELLHMIIGLSDLSRAYGIGPFFAQVLYELGIHSIKELISHSADELIVLYETHTGKKADFGANEMKFCLELAHELPLIV